jgi:hypothetical protein
MAQATVRTTAGATGPQPTPTAQQQTFDAARFAGIFAAIGLAIGAIGTAIASIMTGFLQLAWWQMPLVILAIVLIISGPSCVIAFIKLRNRNLGPILDACGWAVNTQLRINLPFGRALTATAALPKEAERVLNDPYAEKQQPWLLYAAIALGVLAFIIAWRAGYFWAPF